MGGMSMQDVLEMLRAGMTFSYPQWVENNPPKVVYVDEPDVALWDGHYVHLEKMGGTVVLGSFEIKQRLRVGYDERSHTLLVYREPATADELKELGLGAEWQGRVYRRD